MEDLKVWLESVGSIWNYQLFAVDGQPFSLGKIVVGICLLVLSYWLSKRLTSAVERRLLSRLQIDLALRTTLTRVLFYFFMAVGTLFTLHTLHVPITIFAVLGGALAIGFGFGSQNVVNNFISGLILMIEQPVRVGDSIEVDGVKGTIKLIGIRSTHIRTGDNREAVIPNSFLLEKSVVNSTLNDDVVRGRVLVGVGYECKPEQVRDLLLELCKQDRDIRESPAARVGLVDFGSDAMMFELVFWFNFRGVRGGGDIESDLRFAIHREFGKEGISLPYPQRDVHLHVTKALPVTVSERPS